MVLPLVELDASLVHPGTGERLVVVRATEREIVPNHGAQLGNGA